MTVEPVRDIDAARRRAERIRIKARNITEQYAELRALVDEAERCEDHLALGYPSWTAYIADLFGDEPLRLPRDARIPMSNMLAEKGMSTRAIGSMLGVHHDTVATDLRAGVGNPTPEPEPESLDEYRGRVLRDAETNHKVIKLTGPQSVADPTPAKVVGLDGKTYTRPEPKPTEAPRRPTLAPQVQSAGWELTKAVERIQRLAADDRFNAHKDEAAPHLRSHLTNAIEVCQDLLNRINH